MAFFIFRAPAFTSGAQLLGRGIEANTRTSFDFGIVAELAAASTPVALIVQSNAVPKCRPLWRRTAADPVLVYRKQPDKPCLTKALVAANQEPERKDSTFFQYCHAIITKISERFSKIADISAAPLGAAGIKKFSARRCF
ncbi:MAG: hypothetical protein HFF52_04950 [Lawsonibacter sp.]|nr:hypothetical protein [Lawsonibacter sp.]